MEHRTEFNLEQYIMIWKDALLKHRSISMEDAEELECHILDEIDYLISNGVDVQSAFNIAQNNLGKIDILTKEYDKLRPLFSSNKVLPFAATILVLIFSLTVTDLFSKRIETHQFLNLGFEKSTASGNPDNWFVGGDEYEVAIDEDENGKCLKIQSLNPLKQDFGVYSGFFPVKIAQNKMIEYRAKIKTKDVSNGYAGLWWRIDGEKNCQFGFDNMKDRGLVGDNDWTEVSIKMKVHIDARRIKFGGLFTGKGTAWFDDLEIFIDGKKYIEKEYQKRNNIVFNNKEYKKYQQDNDKKYNLNFESSTMGDKLSEGWFTWGGYDIDLDLRNPYEGKYAAVISSKNGSEFGSVAYKIPSQYKGKQITLEGYMKTENVEDGFAGLLLRVDKDGQAVGFDNMEEQAITGTTPWKKYKLSFDFDEESDYIFVAGILVGRGKAWFDDFKVSIDGVDIELKEVIKATVFPAESDIEFDNGSNILEVDISEGSIKNLELLGRIWGFLKYHHPAIAIGKYNWDYELFRFLPEYNKVQNNSERDKLLLNWINDLGPIEKCTDCVKLSQAAIIKPELTWIDKLSPALSISLTNVYKNRHDGKHYYVGMAPSVGNPIFKNENQYDNMAYPDPGYRILSLYRYWNMIQYFAPYKSIIDKNWEDVLREYIPQFINAKDELAYERTVLKIIGDIQDTHANLWGGGNKIVEEKGDYYPPFHVRFIEHKLVVDDFFDAVYRENGELKLGDVITHVNDKSIDQIIAEKKAYYPASNNSAMLRNISFDLLRSTNNKLNISYVSNGEHKKHRLELFDKDEFAYYKWYKKEEGKCYKMLDDNMGYITLQSIKIEDVDKIKSLFKNTDGIIVDIRNYPSTFVPFLLGSFFVKEETPFVKFSSGSVGNPGEFNMTPTINIYNEEEPYQGKLVVLVNELTQSAAEYTTMALQAGINTTIIGSQTSGADGNVSTILLPGGLRTMISGIGVFYPDGEPTQRIGIVPDIEVFPSVEGIKAGKDELLEKAIAFIKQ